MATQLGKTIALTAANMTQRGAGLIISLEALALLAFADDPSGVPEANGNANFVVGIRLAQASSANVSIASGFDALTTPDPSHSTFRIPNNDETINAGTYRRSGNASREHHIVVTGAPPTGTQLLATIGVG